MADDLGGGARSDAPGLRERMAMSLAVEHGIRTIAFPAISCGVYGYPIDDAARIAMSATAAFLGEQPEIERVTFVLFSPAVFAGFEAARRELIDN